MANKKGTRPALRVRCPKCGAEPGKRCFLELSNYRGMIHRARSVLVVERSTIDNQAFRPVYKLGRNPLGQCQSGHHCACPEKRGHTDIVAGCFCTCSCHGVRKSDVYLPYKPPPRKPVNPLMSILCNRGDHDKCSKRRRLPDNLYAPCECECHRDRL
jgi:hypothetical protein